jgi:hypothetical protein
MCCAKPHVYVQHSDAVAIAGRADRRAPSPWLGILPDGIPAAIEAAGERGGQAALSARFADAHGQPFSPWTSGRK